MAKILSTRSKPRVAYRWATANERHFNKSISLSSSSKPKMVVMRRLNLWSLGTPFGAIFNSSSQPKILCLSPSGWGLGSPKILTKSGEEMTSRRGREFRWMLDRIVASSLRWGHQLPPAIRLSFPGLTMALGISGLCAEKEPRTHTRTREDISVRWSLLLSNQQKRFSHMICSGVNQFNSGEKDKWDLQWAKTPLRPLREKLADKFRL